MRDRDILYEFAVQDDQEAALPEYKRRYPHLAADLEELARDIARDTATFEEPKDYVLTAEDYMMVDRAWEHFRAVCRATPSRSVH